MTPLEEHLLKAYLNNELDEQAAEAFEILLIERPDIAVMVDADSALRFGLAQPEVPAVPKPAPAQSPLLDAVVPSNMASNTAKPVHRDSNRRRWFVPPALAAGFSLALGLGAGYLIGRPVESGMHSATLAYVDKTRDISAKASVVLPDAGAVVLLAPVASTESCVSEVVLRQSGMDDMRASAVPDEFGYVSLVLPRAALRLGEAEVEVRCGSTMVSRYAVVFEAAAPQE